MHRAGIVTNVHVTKVPLLIPVHQMPDNMDEIGTAHGYNTPSLQVWYIGNSFHLFVAKICDCKGG